MTLSPTLEAVMQYMSIGWRCVPLRDRPYSADELAHKAAEGKRVGDPEGWRKHPAVEWTKYRAEPPSEMDAMGWWGRPFDPERSWRSGCFSDASGVALICGEASGIIVLDCDPRHGGDATRLPPTGMRARSGGGGTHAFYRWRPDVMSKGKHPFLPGVDVQSDGALCTLSPSIHPSGGVYEWIFPLGDPADAGNELIRTERRAVEKLSEHDNWLREALAEPALDGERHDIAAKIAGSLARRGIPEDITIELVKCWGTARTTLDPGDCEATVRGIYRTDGAAWEPVTWDTEPPEFPLELLSQPVADFCRAMADNVQTTADLPAVQVLGIVSGALSGRRRIMMLNPRTGAPSWDEECGAFWCTVLDPSTGKSPIVKPICIEPIRRQTKVLTLAWRSAHAKAMAAKRTEALELQAIERKLSTHSHADTSFFELASRQAKLIESQDVPLPPRPRLMTADATPEALEKLLLDLPSISLVTDEGRTVFAAAGGAYSGKAKPGPYLHMYSGGDLASDRIGRETKHGRVRGAIVLTAQRQVIMEIGANAVFMGDGLFARFLWSVPGTQPPIQPEANEAPLAMIEWWHSVLQHIWSMPIAERDLHTNDLRDPPAWTTREGTWPLVQFRAELDALGRSGGALDGHGAWLGKMHGAAARLAGVLHALDGNLDAGTISVQTVERAVEICRRYFIPHALRAYELMAGSDLRDARVLWDRFKPVGRFTRRDAERACRGWSEERLRRAIDVLDRRGFARVVNGGGYLEGKRIRSDSLQVLLNPRAT